MVDKFYRQHIVEETFEISQKQDWHLKDILFVPIEGKDVAFRVEHISADKVYFVSIDSVKESTTENVNRFLDEYLFKFPESLKEKMCEIEHKKNGKLIRRSKLTLLSYANVESDVGHTVFDGADDIPFDGLMTSAEKCKNCYGCPCKYFLDTPDPRNSRYLLYIQYYGELCSYNGEFAVGETVPCFALPRKE